jgi:quinol monooxygenase YgiN
MNAQKFILLVQAQVHPEHRQTVLDAAKACLPLTLAEPGCEAMYQTFNPDQPDQLVFFEVFTSEETHALHLAQEYTKTFFSTIEGLFASPPVFTRLTLV